MKKAQEELMFVFSLIFLVVVLTLFFIIMSIASHDKIKNQIDSLENGEININLINYLRTPTNFNNLSISGLITYSYHTNNYDNLKVITQDFFDKFHDKEKCQTMLINVLTKDGDRVFQLISSGNTKTTKDKFALKSNSIFIPTLDADNKLKVTYVEGCTNE